MNLVTIKDYNIRGKLYYVQSNNLAKYNISIDDLAGIGILDDDIFVKEEVVLKLVEINNLLHKE